MHKHICPDCNLEWEHNLKICVIEPNKPNYPCLKCFFIPENNHVIFLSSTPEAALEAKEIHENIIRKSS